MNRQTRRFSKKITHSGIYRNQDAGLFEAWAVHGGVPKLVASVSIAALASSADLCKEWNHTAAKSIREIDPSY